MSYHFKDICLKNGHPSSFIDQCFKTFLDQLFLNTEANLGLLPAVNYYHKVLHLGCSSSPRSASEIDLRS